MVDVEVDVDNVDIEAVLDVTTSSERVVEDIVEDEKVELARLPVTLFAIELNEVAETTAAEIARF